MDISARIPSVFASPIRNSISNPELVTSLRPIVLAPWQAWGSGAVAHGVPKDRVLELRSRLGTSEHQASAAHVAPAHERRGEPEARAEHRKKNVRILRGRDASQKNHDGDGPRSLGEVSRVSFEGRAVAVVIGIDGNPRDASKVIQVYPFFRELQS